MPGILGLISPEKNEHLFNRMIETLNHLDYHVEKHIKDRVHLAKLHLGYVNNSPQPVFSKDERYAIMMIGEIFSYKNIELTK